MMRMICVVSLIALVGCQQKSVREADAPAGALFAWVRFETAVIDQKPIDLAIIPIPGCSACAHEFLSNYSLLRSRSFIVVVSCSDNVVLRAVAKKHKISLDSLIVDNQQWMYRNDFVDEYPVLYRLSENRILRKEVVEGANFHHLIESWP